MTLGVYLNSQFTLMQILDFVARLALACVLGTLIGIERSKRFKEAGVLRFMGSQRARHDCVTKLN